MTIPVFKTEEEEAEFWDKHSPLDFILEPTPETIKVKMPKDRVITIRLDSKSQLKLDRIAREHNVGPSTFARLIIMSALKYLKAESKYQRSEGER